MLSIIREGLPKNPRKWTEMCKQCMGVSEETTTGVKRLYEMQAQGETEGMHIPDHLASKLQSCLPQGVLQQRHSCGCSICGVRGCARCRHRACCRPLLDAISVGGLAGILPCSVLTLQKYMIIALLKQALCPVCGCPPCLSAVLGGQSPFSF